MKRIAPKIFLVIIILTSCSSSSVILQYRDYLSATNVSQVSYDDVVKKLGEPIVKKEFEKEIVASWIDRNLIPPEVRLAQDRYGNKWIEYYDAGKIKGEKIMITFGKRSMKISDWKYKSW